MDIKKLVTYYVKKFGTRNPFDIARSLNIEIQIGPLGGNCGCYLFLKNHRCIFLNDNLNESEMFIVMAHELGHAIMHRKQNCYFIKNKTLLLNSKIEIEANKFAAFLLIDDSLLYDYGGCTKEQFCNCTGYPMELVNLRINE